MIQVVEIENALGRINGDIFQEFCNHFLYIKLNPNSITPIGSVIGKEKSRKGIPDSYFNTSNNELVFAEYTTKEKIENNKSFYNKLESDVKNCFDSKKTGLKHEEINKVILCFTDRIKPVEQKELEILCKGYNKNCTLELKGIRDLAFAVLDYPILGQYLGIKIGSGQIQEPSEFIESYEKNKMTTPLSNTFLGRDIEIKEGINLLNLNSILILHGPAGTGKSKLGIELARIFSMNNDYKFLCIGNEGIPIWEDLKLIIKKDKKYILFIDDANRLSTNFQWILSLFKERLPGSLKIIVTVRDYALNQIRTIAKNYDYSNLMINPFSDEDIKLIIQSKDFMIKNPSYIDRIIKLSKGNARLAIMSCKVALDSSHITELNDASQIYNEYFDSLFNEIEILKDPMVLKTLAIISFFSNIDITNKDFCRKLFSSLNISEDKFWEMCYLLNLNELVDLYEQQVVKISDQVFATYIFYKVVIVDEILDFSFFIIDYINYENRIKDTIIPILNTFNYREVEKKLKPMILSQWHQINEVKNEIKSLKFLNLFWFYLKSQLIVYLKNIIDNQPQIVTDNYRYTYETNEFSSGLDESIEILSRFQFLEDEIFKDALELMIYYAKRIPSKMPSLIYAMREKFCFSRQGYIYGYHIQHLLFDFLIKNAKRADNIIYKNILKEIIPHFLKINFNETEGNNKIITMYTFKLSLTESIKSFREKCFTFLTLNLKKSDVLQVLYRINFFEYSGSVEILNHDAIYILKLITKYFDPNEFQDCFVLQHILEGLNRLKYDYTKDLQIKYDNNLYKLANILKRDRSRRNGLSLEDFEKSYKDELLKFCLGFNFDEYDSLLLNIDLIIKQIQNVSQSNSIWQYETSLSIIFCNLAGNKDFELFLKVLKLSFDSFQFNLNYQNIFYTYLKANPNKYLELFEIIHNLKPYIKIEFYKTLVTNSLGIKDIEFLYLNFLETLKSISRNYIFWDLTFISKFIKFKNEYELYTEVLILLVDKIKVDNVNICVGEKFIEKCLSFNNFNTELLLECYLYSREIEQHFDYEKKILKSLMANDYQVIITFLEFNSPKRISYHDFEHEKLEFIWELDNYLEIINSIFEYFIENENFYYYERVIATFFLPKLNSEGNKSIEYLKCLINEKYLDRIYMKIAFSIICYIYSSEQSDFLELFLKLNSDFSIFESFEIIPRSKSWSGSFIPVLENEKQVWIKVLEVLNNLPNRINYLEHKEHVNIQIENLDKNIKNETKKEFYNDFL